MVDVGTTRHLPRIGKQDHQKLHSPGRSKGKGGDDSIHRSRISQHEFDYQEVLRTERMEILTFPFMTTTRISLWDTY